MLGAGGGGQGSVLDWGYALRLVQHSTPFDKRFGINFGCAAAPELPQLVA